jgi:hypothetical protein
VPPSNPFASRYFQPGAIPFLFPDPALESRLVDRIAEAQPGRCAIVGPHGSGKSTLVAHLERVPSLRQLYPALQSVRLSSNDPSRARRSHTLSRIQAHNLLIVDGFEQFSTWEQAFLRSMASLRRCRLLVTAHAPLHRFETIWETTINPKIETYVLQTILAKHPNTPMQAVMASEGWQRSRARHPMNLRETLFDMYDWYRDTVDAKNREE